MKRLYYKYFYTQINTQGIIAECLEADTKATMHLQ